MDNISSEIPKDVSDILIDLDFITNVPRMHKLNIKLGTYVNAGSWSGAGSRAWYGESCGGTIDYINNTITKAIEIARKYPIWTKIICERTANLKRALSNLKCVYSMNSRNIRKISEFDLIDIRISPQALANACNQMRDSCLEPDPLDIFKSSDYSIESRGRGSPSKSMNLKRSLSANDLS